MKVPSAAMLNLLGYSSSMDEVLAVTQAALNVPGASVHLYGKKECRKGRKMGHITIVGDTEAFVRENLRPLLQALPDATADSTDYAPLVPSPGSGKSSAYPLVGIIMGSDSDLPVMITAARILDNFGVPYELTIVSAHRTPERMSEYARGAAARGLRVIIAGAGGAAHLPGMVAAMTSLPVIGVPVKGSTLDGVDSLYSIVQMPVRDCKLSEKRVLTFVLSAAYQLLLLPSITAQMRRFLPFVYLVLACRHFSMRWMHS